MDTTAHADGGTAAEEPAGRRVRAPRRRSLRLKLSLTYAGMALLTAVILGGVMVAVLGASATRITQELWQLAGTPS